MDVSTAPADWEVHCLPGAKFQHVTRVLKKLKSRQESKLSNIIIQVGINNKDDPTDVVKERIFNLETEAQDLADNIVLAGISYAADLDLTRKLNLDKINQLLKKTNYKYMEPIPSSQLSLRSPGIDDIHFDKDSINLILQEVVKFIHDLN